MTNGTYVGEYDGSSGVGEYESARRFCSSAPIAAGELPERWTAALRTKPDQKALPAKTRPTLPMTAVLAMDLSVRPFSVTKALPL